MSTLTKWIGAVSVLLLLGIVGPLRAAFSADATSGATRAVTYVTKKSTWRYLDDGSKPAGWTAPTFADAGWKVGQGQFGAGDGDETTVINRRNPNHLLDYFRTTFQVTDASSVQSLTLALLADDGAAVYINGTQVLSDNLRPDGYPIAYRGASNGENTYRNFTLPASALVSGTNTIAVELHQNYMADPDSSFDAQLGGTELVPAGTPVTTQPVVVAGSTWRYVDTGTVAAGWSNPTFDDSAWKSGSAQFGAGDGDETTLINRLAPAHLVDYFRTRFQVANLAEIKSLELSLLADDGAIVYLNGTKVVTDNVSANGYATTYRDASTGENSFRDFDVDVSALRSGTNVLAVELHQNWTSDHDSSFDASLTADTLSLAAADPAAPPVTERPTIVATDGRESAGVDQLRQPAHHDDDDDHHHRRRSASLVVVAGADRAGSRIDRRVPGTVVDRAVEAVLVGRVQRELRRSVALVAVQQQLRRRQRPGRMQHAEQRRRVRRDAADHRQEADLRLPEGRHDGLHVRLPRYS